jgi:DNA-binding transcriptional MerR regulator
MTNPPTLQYRIGAIARATGLSSHTIRSWERRYHALSPARSDAGGRLFSEQDLQRLHLLHRAVNAGHAIGTIATLPAAELARLGRDTTPDPAREIRARFLEAVSRFDSDAADRELSHAAAVFPQDRLVREVLAPLLRDVGERWAHSEIGIAQEHLATGLVRSLLLGLTRVQPPPADGRPVVFATLQGERHEMGLLLAAFLAAARRRRVVYLGLEVPAADLAHAARLCRAAAIALSVVSPAEGTPEALDLLAALAPRDSQVWLGGAASQAHAAAVSAHGWSLLSGIDDLDAALARLPA